MPYFDRGVIRHPAKTQGLLVMTRPACAAIELSKGFQTSPGRVFAVRRAHAYVTLLMASVLTLATLIVVATVSIEVVKAATLH